MANPVRKRRRKPPKRPTSAPSPMRGLLMIAAGVALAGGAAWLLWMIFSTGSYIGMHVGGKGRGMALGMMVIGLVSGVACTVDGVLRLLRFGAERIAWERVMAVDGAEDRLVNELLMDVVDEARRIPGDESRGELRMISRRRLKAAGICGAPLVEYLAHRLATEADAKL